MLKLMKKIVSLVLCACTLIGVLTLNPTTVSAATYTKTSQVSGSDFTSRPKLAKALDSIFAGKAGVYSDKYCKKMVNTALGTRSVPNNGVTQYVGEYGKYRKNSGTSCWIYSNAVYLTLFGEALGSGSPGKNSEKLNLSTSSKKLTYENMCAWGVRRGVGAQIRVGNHSIIVLGYDQSGLTYLDGNGDGKGLVAVRDLTWKQVRNTGAINGAVSYIIQPKESYLNELYPCSHSYNSSGICSGCGAEFKIVSYKATGTYRVVKNTTAKQQPYAAAKTVRNLSKYQTVKIICYARNAFGNLWVYTSAGYWIYAGNLQRVSGSYLPK